MTMHLWWCSSWIENESTLINIIDGGKTLTVRTLFPDFPATTIKYLCLLSLTRHALVWHHLLTSSLVAHVHSSYTTYVFQSTCVLPKSEVTPDYATTW